LHYTECCHANFPQSAARTYYRYSMIKPCYRRHRFPIDVIQQAVWLYFWFPLSFRDVEDLLAKRGIDVSYETVRRWSVKFGLAYAKINTSTCRCALASG
jgi:transposase-like protein